MPRNDSDSESSGRDEYGIKVDPADVKDFGSHALYDEKKREKERERKRRERRSRSSSSSSSSSSSDDDRRRRKRRRRRRSRSRSRDRRRRKHRKRRRSSVDRSSRSKKPKVKKYKFWDIAPEGFEHVTVKQYKEMQATGQVAVQAPGATVSGNIDEVTRGGSKNNRTYLSLYVGGIPFGATEQNMVEFFNAQMRAAKLNSKTPDPVLACRINMDKNFAFIEFKERAECTNALAFDGVEYRGAPLKIRRPLDYKPPDDDLGLPEIHLKDVVGTVVRDSVNKVFIGGLPSYLNDDQVKELLQAFGPLRSFNLVKDSTTGFSKGFGFCEYVDVSVTDQAIAGLHGMMLGERRLVVQRAAVGQKGDPMAKHGPTSIQVPGINFTEAIKESKPTTVVCLLNMVTQEELKDDEEYEDIVEDIHEECGKYGRVVSVEIPRPTPGVDVKGLGRIFVEFAAIGDSMQAVNGLGGRKFAQRIVMTSYFDPEKYHTRDFE